MDNKFPESTLLIKPGPWKDTPNERVLDLRKDGVGCIPVLERIHLTRQGDDTTRFEHVHVGCLEVTFCQRGEVVFESMGTNYPVLPGKLFVSRPDEPHRQRRFPKGQLTYGFLFKVPSSQTPILNLPLRESRWLRDRLLTLPQRCFAAADGVRQAFQRLFDIYDEEVPGSPQRSLRLRTAALDLLLAVVDSSRIIGEMPRANQRVEALVGEIQRDPAIPLVLDEAAAKTGLSVSTLILAFKRLTGLPPLAFRNACRIEAAKKRLRGGESIGSIALRLGFSSTQNFATKFRLATGQTPSAWRTAK